MTKAAFAWLPAGFFQKNGDGVKMPDARYQPAGWKAISLYDLPVLGKPGQLRFIYCVFIFVRHDRKWHNAT